MMLLPLLLLPFSNAILYPYETASRQLKSLDGLWKFKLDPNSIGHDEEWFNKALTGSDVLDMPVPSSFNDISTDASVRDYLGLVWYDKEFFLTSNWFSETIMLRFGSVHYLADVWVDGIPLGSHEGGHMAFEFDISDVLDKDSTTHRVTVAVSNVLTPDTVPQGDIVIHDDYIGLENQFDFFNYAGIHRPVVLYTTPFDVRIEDIDMRHDFPNDDLNTAKLSWNIIYQAPEDLHSCAIDVYFNSSLISSALCSDSELTIDNPTLWWPLGMGHLPGQMYDITVTVQSLESQRFDQYTLPIGIRKLKWDTK